MSNKDRVSIATSDHDRGGSQLAEAPNIEECDSDTGDMVDLNSPSTHGAPTDLQGATRPSEAAPARSHVDDSSDSDSSDDDAPRALPNPPPTRAAKKKKARRNFGVFPAGAGFPGYNPDDYEQKYPFDSEVSEAMGPNARVWRVYLDEAKAFDDDMIEGWRDTIDVLLVFAGLFSAVVTTLVTQASQSLQPNYAQISASLLVELVDIQRAVALGLSRDMITQSSQNSTTMASDAGSSDKWVNGLWFVSLALSLATALLSMLVKQWFQYYISPISGSVQQKAHTHQFRFAGLQKWHVSTIVGCLPIMMHLALLLFFAGLVVYVWSLNKGIAVSVLVIVQISYLVYFGTNLLASCYIQCPYKTPIGNYIFIVKNWMLRTNQNCIHLIQDTLSKASFRWFKWMYYDQKSVQDVQKALDSHVALPQSLKAIENNTIVCQKELLDIQSLYWLYQSSDNSTVGKITLQALSGANLFKHDLTLFNQQYIVDIITQELISSIENKDDINIEYWGWIWLYISDSLFQNSLFTVIRRAYGFGSKSKLCFRPFFMTYIIYDLYSADVGPSILLSGVAGMRFYKDMFGFISQTWIKFGVQYLTRMWYDKILASKEFSNISQSSDLNKHLQKLGTFHLCLFEHNTNGPFDIQKMPYYIDEQDFYKEITHPNSFIIFFNWAMLFSLSPICPFDKRTIEGIKDSRSLLLIIMTVYLSDLQWIELCNTESQALKFKLICNLCMYLVLPSEHVLTPKSKIDLLFAFALVSFMKNHDFTFQKLSYHSCLALFSACSSNISSMTSYEMCNMIDKSFVIKWFYCLHQFVNNPSFLSMYDCHSLFCTYNLFIYNITSQNLNVDIVKCLCEMDALQYYYILYDIDATIIEAYYKHLPHLTIIKMANKLQLTDIIDYVIQDKYIHMHCDLLWKYWSYYFGLTCDEGENVKLDDLISMHKFTVELVEASPHHNNWAESVQKMITNFTNIAKESLLISDVDYDKISLQFKQLQIAAGLPLEIVRGKSKDFVLADSKDNTQGIDTYDKTKLRFGVIDTPDIEDCNQKEVSKNVEPQSKQKSWWTKHKGHFGASDAYDEESLDPNVIV